MIQKSLLIAATLATTLAGGLWSVAPATAQGVQLNVCGAPPLPPCRGEERTSRGRAERLSDVCQTRTTRCRVDEPARSGARCTCEDSDGEELVGRIR